MKLNVQLAFHVYFSKDVETQGHTRVLETRALRRKSEDFGNRYARNENPRND